MATSRDGLHPWGPSDDDARYVEVVVDSWTLARARALRWANQGLGGAGTAGWTRCIGGILPHLSSFARQRLTRAEVDARVAEDALVISQGVRGCIWVVPREEASTALAIGTEVGTRRTLRDLDKTGVDAGEIARTQTAVVEALAAAPAPIAELRARLPEGAVRSLGAAGKKIGVSSTLPPVLRLLESQGRVRRLAAEGRLDLERYRWALAPDGWHDPASVPEDPLTRVQWLLTHFLRRAAPATLEQFCAWSQAPKGRARKAAAALGVVEVAVEGQDGSWWVLPDQTEAPAEARGVRLLGCLDNLLSMAAPAALLLDAPHRDLPILVQGGRTKPAATVKWPLVRPLVADGAWVGVWAWDEAATELVTRLFPGTAVDAAALAAEADAVRARILGDFDGVAKVISIDGPKQRARRVAWVRSA
jgi:hypothetical protein